MQEQTLQQVQSPEKNWNDFEQMFKSDYDIRKTVEFDVHDDVITFEVKQLTQREYDAVRNKMVIKTSRGQGAEIPINMGEYNKEIIKFGVTKGPDGFSPKNPKHIEVLPVHIRDELARCIEEFSELDEVTRCKFRAGREDRE